MWLDDLDEFPLVAIDAAMTAHRRDPEAGRFCPRVADIIRGIRGSGSDQAIIAWSNVLSRACNRGGDKFDQTTLKALEALGGFDVVRMADEEQNGFLQKRFVEAYAVHARRAEVQAIAQTAQALRIAGSKR